MFVGKVFLKKQGQPGENWSLPIPLISKRENFFSFFSNGRRRREMSDRWRQKLNLKKEAAGLDFPPSFLGHGRPTKPDLSHRWFFSELIWTCTVFKGPVALQLFPPLWVVSVFFYFFLENTLLYRGGKKTWLVLRSAVPSLYFRRLGVGCWVSRGGVAHTWAPTKLQPRGQIFG